MFDRLWVVSENIYNPSAKVSGEAQMKHFTGQYVWNESVEGRTVINKEHLNVGLSVFEVLIYGTAHPAN